LLFNRHKYQNKTFGVSVFMFGGRSSRDERVTRRKLRQNLSLYNRDGGRTLGVVLIFFLV